MDNSDIVAPSDCDKNVQLSIRERPRLSPDSPWVYHPRYSNAEKTRLRAIVRLPDGRITEVGADRSDTRSPLIRDIFAQYSEDEIAYFTTRHERMASAKQELDLRVNEDRRVNSVREATAAAKAQALEIPEIRNSNDPLIKRKIRTAKSTVEVNAWVAVALFEAKAEGRIETEGATV